MMIDLEVLAKMINSILSLSAGHISNLANDANVTNLANMKPIDWTVTGPILQESVISTLYMVLVTLLIGGFLGLILGLSLYTTRKGGLFQNVIVYQLLNFCVNIIRPIPFIIFIGALQGFTVFLIGTSIGTTAVLVPMIIFCTVASSRLVEQALVSTDEGIIEATRSMGASKIRTIFEVVIPESLAPLLLSYAFLFVGIVDMSVMAGLIGGGGLGNFAIVYGYNKFNTTITWISIAIIIVMVQFVQQLANLLSKRFLKR
jgi:D-methionine transport system permease protein